MSPLLPRQLLLNRELQLEDGCNYVYEVQNDVHKSSCIELYFQCGLQCTTNNMLLELLTQIIHEPCFNILRTKVSDIGNVEECIDIFLRRDQAYVK